MAFILTAINCQACEAKGHKQKLTELDFGIPGARMYKYYSSGGWFNF
jgi:hypothetical protein